MPTLDITPEKAQELLELAAQAENLSILDPYERRRLHDLRRLLSSILLEVQQ